MNTITNHKSTTRMIAMIAVAVFAFFAFIFLIVGRVGAETINNNDGRLITIYDRGLETVIVSEAKTVAAALQQADITIDEKDVVEPSLDQELIAHEYQINIYRSRPVIVIDGKTRQKINTAYQTGSQIAESVGIQLYDEDITTLSRTNDLVSEGAGLTLTIDRALPFTFDLYGATTISRTQAITVGDMLKQKGMTLGSSDRVSPSESTTLTEDITVRVWREGKQTITVDEPVAFSTEYIQDGDQYVGYRAVKSSGKVGLRSVTYEIVVKDGIEIGRAEIASITTKVSINQVEVVGAKYRGAYTTPTENEVITWNFLIAQGFSREQTAGIMGNLMQEHRFNTTGDGLAQWTDGRKAALLAMPDPYNIYTQLEFLMIELNGKYSGVRDAIKSTTSVEDAVIIFQDKFERCNPVYCMQSQRIQYAYNILASH